MRNSLQSDIILWINFQSLELEYLDIQAIKKVIQNGNAVLGIEMGSTRIKAVLIDEKHNPIASGSHGWENRFENGVWTYHLDDVWTGLQDAYKNLKDNVFEKYGVKLTKLKAMGFSAMMHGYLPFDKDGKQLAEFRTWRNTITEKASSELTELFKFNIPQRWSIAHLYQAILNQEEHISNIDFLTTLEGYVHWMLTGKKVIGIGEAAGMFPIDSTKNCYDEKMVEQFNALVKQKGYSFDLLQLLPEILLAGDLAGTLTKEGALLLDPTGELESGCPLCPPEGDAGTGMVATNSVAAKTGNISAGTSIFGMIVLDKALSDVYTEIDMVTTPTGKPVAMVHCNTCTSDLDAYVKLFAEVLTNSGVEVNKPALYDMLYLEALKGDADCNGIISFNYYSGEPVTDTAEGRPLLVRMPDSKFNLANFMRAQLYGTMATLRLGMNILFDKENVQIAKLLGHGGLFKTPVVGQKLMAGALNTPVAVMETAGEGGAWGIALLAAYMANKGKESLEEYLDNKVFAEYKATVIEPDKADVDGFNEYINRYESAVAVEKSAINTLK